MENPINDPGLAALVADLRKARRAFLDAALGVSPGKLDSNPDEAGWTARRVIEYCRAVERFHFTRMFHFFDRDAPVYDSPAASLDHVACEDTNRSLAAECSQVWLAGRETQMWLDVIAGQDLDLSRGGGGTPSWTIRQVFHRITALYRRKAAQLNRL